MNYIARRPTRRRSRQQQQQNHSAKLNSKALQRLREINGKPFWIEDPIRHEELFHRSAHKCCFNHVIGLPVKDAETKPIFDYELEIYKYLEKGKTEEKYKHLWIKKARGLGITEFFLRYMGWRALCSNEFKAQRFIVVTGTHERVAQDLIRRIKNLFQAYLTQDPYRDLLILNGVTIEAFPSHIAATRGYEDFKFILLDEADYFRPNEQEELMPAIRGFIAKTHPYIIMVSTPHQPGSLFHKIEQMKSDEEAGFIRLQYLYQRGLGKIYKEVDIEEEKKHEYFKREYEGQYAFGVGTLFAESAIMECERLGREVDGRLSSFPIYQRPSIRESTRKSLGIDLGWGATRTAFVLTEWVENRIRVVYSEQFDRPAFDRMVKHAYNLIRQYSLDNGTNKIFIDGSAPSFIGALKTAIGENADYLKLVALARESESDPVYYMNIVPVNFSQKNQHMLDHTKEIVDRGMLAINPDASQGHQDLLTDLRIAKNKLDTFKLDKKENRMDLFDALRMALEFYK